MKFLSLIIVLIFTSAISLPCYAQYEDLGEILEEIIKQGTPSQTPIYGGAAIETIPVTIRFDVPDSLDNHMIILSAHTPKDPSGKTTKTQLLGQNRLLMNGLESPLQLIIAVPETVTENLTFARITAEIRDENNNRVMINEREALYRGTDPSELTLIATDKSFTNTPIPAISGLEIINGEVSIRDKRHIPNGGTLTIQLLETGLVGGTSITIAAEKTIYLDRDYPPYKFTLDRGLTEDQQNTPLSLKAWITDWAGRKTHVLRTPIPYNGPDSDYKLTLDAITQGINTDAGRHLDPALMAQTIIAGDAVYDPNNGIPGGARLKATLSKSVGAFGENRVLSQQTIIVGQQGNRIPFSLAAASTNFDPFIPAPILKLEITDTRGNIYYDSGDISAREEHQTIQLYPRQN